eukprot:253538-Chlamydomonas_euryale.AAC.1
MPDARITDTIKVANRAVLAAQVDWLAGTTKTAFQTVTASLKAWGKPWFDRVSVCTTDEPNRTAASQVWYAEVRLWFRRRRRSPCLCAVV